jgi:TDG/mug DNA glycosylase family protein
LGQYYAGRGNKFWRTLAEVGLTPRRLLPEEYALLPGFGIGLTDLVKGQSGGDAEIEFDPSGRDALRARMQCFQPRVLCFNGKRAAGEFFRARRVTLGLQTDTIGGTQLFVAPSTSGAASGSWDVAAWKDLAEVVRAGT